MEPDRLPRKLAAILYADVAGYSRLTGDDEEGTHLRLRDYLDLLAQSIRAHHGSVVHYAGDAVLADFETVTDALTCAVSVQRTLRTRNGALPSERKVQFRIGVNLGEVIVDRDDIYGDGVNVAARLEGLAEPGGICISEAVRSAIGARLPIAYRDLGKQQVKNIAEPVLAYQVNLEPETPATGNRRSRQRKIASIAVGMAVTVAVAVVALRHQDEPAPLPSLQPAPLAMASKPSVAVLPFSNRSDDPEQSYFADGITDDLTTDLSRVSGLFVIASASSRRMDGESLAAIRASLGVQYVVQGNVRRAGSSLRINIELIDVATGGNIWAQRYDGRLDDVFALQDRVTRQVAQALAVRLTDAEAADLWHRSTNDTVAYDYLLRGNAVVSRLLEESNLEARSLYLAALERDPNFARAHSALALTHAYDWRFDWSEDDEASLSRALAGAQTAVRLAPGLEQAHFVLGVVRTYMRQSDAAIEAARRATKLNPNYADAFALLSFALTHAGRAGEGLTAAEEAIRLNPGRPWLYLFHRGRASFFLGRHDAAIADIEASIEKNPGFAVSQIYLTATYAVLGRTEDADWASIEVLNLLPDFGTAAWLKRNGVFTDQAYEDRLIEALARTELPP